MQTLINILDDILDSSVLSGDDRMLALSEDISLSLLKLAQTNTKESLSQPAQLSTQSSVQQMLESAPIYQKHLPVYRGLAYIVHNANIKGTRTFINQGVRRNPVDALWGLMVGLYLNYKPDLRNQLFPGGNRFLSIATPDLVRDVSSVYNAQWGDRSVPRMLGFDPVEPGWGSHIESQITPIMGAADLSMGVAPRSRQLSPSQSPTQPMSQPTPQSVSQSEPKTELSATTDVLVDTSHMTEDERKAYWQQYKNRIRKNSRKNRRSKVMHVEEMSKEIYELLSPLIMKNIDKAVQEISIENDQHEDIIAMQKLLSDIKAGGLSDIYTFVTKHPEVMSGRVDSSKMMEACKTIEEIMQKGLPPDRAVSIIINKIFGEVYFSQHGILPDGVHAGLGESWQTPDLWVNSHALEMSGAFLTLLKEWISYSDRFSIM